MKYDVITVGDINIELTFTGLKSMPALGSEILANSMLSTLGGSSVNTAAGLARLGAKSAFIGRVGRDANGDFLVAALQSFGCDASGVVRDAARPSGITVSLAAFGDRAMITNLGAIAALCVRDIPDAALENARHLHVGSYFLQAALRPGLPELFDRAHRLGLTTSLDIGWDDTGGWDAGIGEVIRRADIIFPNETEALHLSHRDSVEAAAGALGTLCPTVVVKWGKRGAYLRHGTQTCRLPAYSGKPVDTTGAGDAFNAGFLRAFTAGLSLEDCLRWGLAAGSISVTRHGSAVSCPSAEEVAAKIAAGEIEV